MTYYFIGGEDLDFSPIGGPNILTGSQYFRAGYARCGLNSGFGSWRVPASYGLSVTGTSWVTARVYTGSGAGGVPLFTFNGPGDVAALQLRSDGSLWKIVSGTPTKLATGTGSVPFEETGGAKLDIDLNFNNVSGGIDVYFDGDLIVSYTGDTTGGQASFNGFDLSNGVWSEVMWADHDTRALGLVTLAPVANGATNTFDVHNVSFVNEIVLNDAVTDQSGTANQIELYTVGSLPAGNYGIDAVEVVSRTVTASGAPQNLQLMVRAGGTNYNSISYGQLTSFNRDAGIWPTNPNTATFWKQADLGSGFQIGIESIT